MTVKIETNKPIIHISSDYIDVRLSYNTQSNTIVITYNYGCVLLDVKSIESVNELVKMLQDMNTVIFGSSGLSNAKKDTLTFNKVFKKIANSICPGCGYKLKICICKEVY